jgi:hypothetical protein
MRKKCRRVNTVRCQCSKNPQKKRGKCGTCVSLSLESPDPRLFGGNCPVPMPLTGDDAFCPENNLLTALLPKQINPAVQKALPECYGNGSRHMDPYPNGTRRNCTPGMAGPDRYSNYTTYSLSSIDIGIEKLDTKYFVEYVDKVNNLSITSMSLGTGDIVRAGCELPVTLTAQGYYEGTALKSYIYFGVKLGPPPLFITPPFYWNAIVENDKNFQQSSRRDVSVKLTFECHYVDWTDSTIGTARLVLPKKGEERKDQRGKACAPPVQVGIQPELEVHAGGLSGLCSLWGGSDDCLDVGLRDVTSDVRDVLADLLFKELTDENIDLPNSVKIDGWNIPFPTIFQNISLSVVDITNIVALKMSINDPAVGLLCPEKPSCIPDVRPCARGTCVRSVPPNPIAPDMGHCECLKDPCETP